MGIRQYARRYSIPVVCCILLGGAVIWHVKFRHRPETSVQVVTHIPWPRKSDIKDRVSIDLAGFGIHLTRAVRSMSVMGGTGTIENPGNGEFVITIRGAHSPTSFNHFIDSEASLIPCTRPSVPLYVLDESEWDIPSDTDSVVVQWDAPTAFNHINLGIDVEGKIGIQLLMQSHSMPLLTRMLPATQHDYAAVASLIDKEGSPSIINSIATTSEYLRNLPPESMLNRFLAHQNDARTLGNDSSVVESAIFSRLRLVLEYQCVEAVSLETSNGVVYALQFKSNRRHYFLLDCFDRKGQLACEITVFDPNNQLTGISEALLLFSMGSE